LVVASSHPAEAIEIRGLVPLSIFIFSATQFVAQTNDLQSPMRSAHVQLLSNAPPTTERQVLRPALNFLIGAILARLRRESTPRVPSRSHLITSPLPPASANLRFVVVSIDKTVAT